ncbi:MAG TPA: TIGR03435 family protein [Acidobacteriaceae bacterium]|nr:TIGR03435 family protein [Acidobacteriaceae bacterium]
MIKTGSAISGVVCLAGMLLPLPLASQRPSFAVATIRPSAAPVAFEHDGNTQFSADTLRMQDVTVSTCIKLAYHVQDRQIIGPEWIRSDHFDITAKSDGPAEEEEMKRMLQALLADRFGLTFHREQKEMKALVLTVAPGGAKVKPAAAPDGKPLRQNSAIGTVAKSMPIAEFADFISGPLEMPVVDHTGLTGKYDFVLDFTSYLPDPAKNMDGTKPDTTAILKAALHDELGLNMESSKTQVEVLRIDHIEKPSEN